MYIKQIRSKKNENGGSIPLYYVLCVRDSKKNIWVERYISSDLAYILVENFRVSLKEIYTSKVA